MVVQSELGRIGVDVYKVDLGEIFLNEPLSETKRHKLAERLNDLGFELIDNKKSRIIEEIKRVIIQQIQNSDQDSGAKYNLSAILSQNIHHDYNYLSNLFSEVEGVTIEKYYIAQKIEKVKELLVYDELSLSEIAFRLGYSSVAYLSNQFKKVTGLTPSHFKKIKENKRKPLDEV